MYPRRSRSLALSAAPSLAKPKVEGRRKMSTKGSKADELKRLTRRAFLDEERLRQSERRVIEEEQRMAKTAAKTSRLRGLREARDAAAELEAGGPAKSKAPPKKKEKSSRKDQRVERG